MRTVRLAAALATLTVLAPLAAADPGRTIVVGHPRIAAVIDEPAGEPAAMPPLAEPREGRDTTIFGLPKNVGPGDRILRTVIGLGLAGAGVYGLTEGDWSKTTSGVLLGVSAVPFATAATGYCPLYQVLGIDRSF